MRPILLRIPWGAGEVALGSYSTFYLLAWLLAPALGVWLAARGGFSAKRSAVLYYGSLLAGIVGARLLDLFVAARFYIDEPQRAWALSFQGYSLYGGLVVACVVAVGLARVWRLDVWRLADASVPAIVLGVVLMRAGCFLRGCCFGIASDLPWAVTYPRGSLPWTQQVLRGETGLISALGGGFHPVHPTQLYEIAAAVLLGAASFALTRRRVPAGVPFLAFAAGFTAFRLANGFLRARQDVITAPWWFYPVTYGLIIAVLLGLVAWRFVTMKSADEATGEQR